MLDAEDGLSWETFCDCSILWSIESAGLERKLGIVSPDRRNAIRDRIRDMLLLNSRD